MTSGHFVSNFKTMKKSIVGKYDKFKTYGMIWIGKTEPYYINFDLENCESEYTQKLIEKWKIKHNILTNTDTNGFEPLNNSTNHSIVNSNKKEEVPSFEYSSQQMNDLYINNQQSKEISSINENISSIENLYSQAEEISRRISFLISQTNFTVNDSKEPSYQNTNTYLEQMNTLKAQRKNIWKRIEEEELKANSLINKNKIQSPQLIKNLDISSNELKDKVIKLPEKLNENIETKSFKNQQEKLPETDHIFEVNNESKKAKYHFYLSSCSQNDNSSIILNEQENLSNDPKYKIITDKMKNFFHCNENSTFDFNLNYCEMKLIYRIIDDNDNNFALDERKIGFIHTDLCYLIPGIFQNGVTVIIFINESESTKNPLKTTEWAGQRINYLNQICNIKTEKIIDCQSNATETSSIFSQLVKNEIKFLYISADAIKNNPKLVTILNIVRSKNNLNRIVFIVHENHLNDITENQINMKIANTMRIIIDSFKGVPLLLITNKLTDLLINALSISPENIISAFQSDNEAKLAPIKSMQNEKIRNNLFLEVMQKKSSLLTRNLEDISNWLIKNHYISNEKTASQVSCSGIIFCLTNRDAESINAWLNKNGFSAAFFHSKMNDQQQREVIVNWESGVIKIVVIADVKNKQLKNRSESQELQSDNQKELYKLFDFKQDIRFIVHYTIPQSMSEYINQINLAGKDGYISHSLLMFNEIDVKIIQRMITISPMNTLDSQEDSNVDNKKQEDELKAIIEYCMKDDDDEKNYLMNNCRRVEIMKHYGISYKYQNCYCMCDMCEKHSEFEKIKHDTTIHGNNMLKIIKTLNDDESMRNIKPTLSNVIDIYIGKKCIKKRDNENNEINDEYINIIAPCAPEFKESKILLVKTISELCNRGILKILTKKVAHGSIRYLELNKNCETIDEPIFA